jgi:hypothetical protein
MTKITTMGVVITRTIITGFLYLGGSTKVVFSRKFEECTKLQVSIQAVTL